MSYIKNIELQVADLDRAADFYSAKIGMNCDSTDKTAYLYTGSRNDYLIKLTEIKGSKNSDNASTGLFHVAIKVPDRSELARIFMRLYNKEVKFGGFSDHIVSEAIYLQDPDGNGVEIYSDKPESEWKWNFGEVEMNTYPLDLNNLVKDIKENDTGLPIDSKTKIGHIHLKVSDIYKAADFYSGILGMKVTTRSYSGALFFAYDNYHHHVGANMWSSKNGNPKHYNQSGLLYFTLALPQSIDKHLIIDKLEKQNLVKIKSADYIETTDFDNNKIKLLI